MEIVRVPVVMIYCCSWNSVVIIPISTGKLNTGAELFSVRSQCLMPGMKCGFTFCLLHQAGELDKQILDESHSSSKKNKPRLAALIILLSLT